MMKYGVRVALGCVAGLALAVGLALWLDRAWIGALAGGLGGPLVFLATFFIWSADRPKDGYEQVLFDRPNTLLSGVMLVALVGVAFGAGWLFGGPDGPALSAEEEAALAEMETAHAEIQRLAAAYGNATDARATGGDPGDLAAGLAAATDARAAVQTLEVPESMEPMRAALQKTARALEEAYGALQKCVESSDPTCLDARIAHADMMRGLQQFGEAKAAL